MGKLISKGSAKPDDPLFSGGLETFTIRKPQGAQAMAHPKDNLDDKPIEEVAHTHYEFAVPYVHYKEEDTPPQMVEVWPCEGLGYCVQYRYDGEAYGSKAVLYLEAALVLARHQSISA